MSRHRAGIPVSEYVAAYVDASRFEQLCRTCPSYGSTWGCPPHQTNPLAIWAAYRWLHVLAIQLHFAAADRAREWPTAGLRRELGAARDREKAIATGELAALVRQLGDGSRLLHAGGACTGCPTCTRPAARPCPTPQRIQYSIESLGGDVGRTVSQLLGIELAWADAHHLPATTSVVFGILSDRAELPDQLK
ncbi:DUF2284 domain-containing protein [Brooklawnia sp.]|uniref:DUF2284 domain-containing protein n=1 Tax=Brooklawnia sp. TaxID=2699740 RepID=UPI003C745CC4